MSFNVKPTSTASNSIDAAKSTKQLKLPTQKESFEQVLADQLQASVKKNVSPPRSAETNQTIELQRRSLHFNLASNGQDVRIEIIDDSSEEVIRKISNHTVDKLIKQSGGHPGSTINTQV